MELRAAAERALGDAAREGLTLVRSASATGFKGVYHRPAKSKTFEARLKQKSLGYYATAEEAALAYARAAPTTSA